MNNRYRALAICGILFLAGCAAAPNGDKAAQTSEAEAAGPQQAPKREVPASRRIPPQPQPQPQPAPADPQKEPVGMTFGRGIAKGPDDMTFMLNATLYKDESVGGKFSYSASGDAGTLDIEAEITCASLDNEAGRAWVGGKVTRNGSTDPRFAGATEVWMRALDRNSQRIQPLVSGPLLAAGKIKTASDYCNKKPWSDEDLYVVDPGALAVFP